MAMSPADIHDVALQLRQHSKDVEKRSKRILASLEAARHAYACANSCKENLEVVLSIVQKFAEKQKRTKTIADATPTVPDDAAPAGSSANGGTPAQNSPARAQQLDTPEERQVSHGGLMEFPELDDVPLSRLQLEETFEFDSSNPPSPTFTSPLDANTSPLVANRPLMDKKEKVVLGAGATLHPMLDGGYLLVFGVGKTGKIKMLPGTLLELKQAAVSGGLAFGRPGLTDHSRKAYVDFAIKQAILLGKLRIESTTMERPIFLTECVKHWEDYDCSPDTFMATQPQPLSSTLEYVYRILKIGGMAEKWINQYLAHTSVGFEQMAKELRGGRDHYKVKPLLVD